MVADPAFSAVGVLGQAPFVVRPRRAVIDDRLRVRKGVAQLVRMEVVIQRSAEERFGRKAHDLDESTVGAQYPTVDVHLGHADRSTVEGRPPPGLGRGQGPLALPEIADVPGQEEHLVRSAVHRRGRVARPRHGQDVDEVQDPGGLEANLLVYRLSLEGGVQIAVDAGRVGRRQNLVRRAADQIGGQEPSAGDSGPAGVGDLVGPVPDQGAGIRKMVDQGHVPGPVGRARYRRLPEHHVDDAERIR